ncbi:tetratricopeptide repeat protein [uncultured Brevundimonas sp.]|uniref:winged helix-turn-helix domain-containing protein n=1 Tax=uncultured Brevundimonas sp. TaxID=213418 RepID=UPI0030EB7B31
MAGGAPFRLGEWTVEPALGRLSRNGEVRAVEPKMMDVLVLLASRPGQVFGRERIFASVWPGVTVGEDTLTRCISKLRTALGDEARQPRYLETISKRGYRLVAAVEPVGSGAEPVARPARVGHRRRWLIAAAGLVGAGLVVIGALALGPGSTATPDGAEAARLTQQAHDFYFQYSRADNQAARTLYERAVALDPDASSALAGLSNTLVQTVIRWPGDPGETEFSRTTLGAAMATGRTGTPAALARLNRARSLAERAVTLKPDDAFAQQSLGLVAAAQQDFEVARMAYDRAIALDPDAWGAMINRADLMEIQGDRTGSIVWFERAYAAMSRVHETQAPRVRPWQSETGILIARRYEEAGRPDAAETWYRRVLAATPFHPAGTSGLAALLDRQGDRSGARELCRTYVERIGPNPGCASILVD